MTEHDALLRAICEHPAADTPRLVFADWLDEHADALAAPAAARAWAAFIRDDVSLSARDGYDPVRLRWELIEKPRRETEGWMKEAFAPLLPWLKDARPLFRRGFPWMVRATPDEFMAHGGRLRATYPFTALALAGQQPSTDTLFRSRHFAGITTLRVKNAFLWPQSVRVLADSPHAAGLEELASHGGLTQPAVAALVRSPLFARLTRFDLAHGSGGFGAAFVTNLPDAKAPVRLRDLNLTESGLTGPYVERLVDSPVLTRLARLVIAKCRLGQPGTEALARADLPHLRDLDLSETIPGTDGIRALFASHLFARLERFTYARNHVAAGHLVELAERSEVANLRALDLAGNAVGNVGTTALARSPHFANLLVLNLSNCMVGDEGATAILESPLAERLAFLDLTVSPMSADMKELVKARMGDRVRV